MALEPVTQEVFAEISRVLGLENLNRPHAAFIDPGDFGTIFSYIPIFKNEFKKLPIELQKHVYVIDKGRYGLAAFVPKTFFFAGDGEVVNVTEVYNLYGNLKELSYQVSDQTQVFHIEHPLRRELLQTLAKKKKIPVKKIIRS
jgi:hypothetical protein